MVDEIGALTAVGDQSARAGAGGIGAEGLGGHDSIWGDFIGGDIRVALVGNSGDVAIGISGDGEWRRVSASAAEQIVPVVLGVGELDRLFDQIIHLGGIGRELLWGRQSIGLSGDFASPVADRLKTVYDVVRCRGNLLQTGDVGLILRHRMRLSLEIEHLAHGGGVVFRQGDLLTGGGLGLKPILTVLKHVQLEHQIIRKSVAGYTHKLIPSLSCGSRLHADDRFKHVADRGD